MPPISTLVAKTQARRQAQAQAQNGTGPESESGTPIAHAPAAPAIPVSPGAPPQDLPVASPQRGSLPASLVNVSDWNDSQRQFRTGPVRSAIFPYPAPTSATGSDKIAQIQASIAATQTETATVKTQQAQTAAKFAALNMDTIPEGVAFGKPMQTALTPVGVVDTTQTGVQAQGGSFPPQIVGTTSIIFSYTSTASTHTVVITWSAITLLYPDGTSVTVPSGSQTITGVSTGTYYFYPYTLPAPLGVVFALVSGGSGTPAILYSPQSPTAAQVANLQSVTALSNGGVAVVMPASGGGSGGGGGSGICLRDNTLVLHREKGETLLLDCEIGDFIMGRTDWTEILAKRVLPMNKFVRVTASHGEKVQMTPTHCTTVMRNGIESSVPAQDLSLSDFLIVKGGFDAIAAIEFIEEDGRKIKVTCEPEHEFFAGQTHPMILVHNVQPIS